MKKINQKVNQIVNQKIIEIGLNIQNKIRRSKQLLIEDESGMGIIEVAIIIVVIIGLAVIFETQITKLLNDIFAKFNIDSIGKGGVE